MLRDKYTLIHKDTIATVSYTYQGGLRCHRMLQLARHLLLWSLTQLKTLRTIHIVKRNGDSNPRWSSSSGVDSAKLSPSSASFFLSEWNQQGRAGTQMDPGESPCTNLCEIREKEEQVLLVHLTDPPRTWYADTSAPRDNPL
ncbi:hypothetical protein M9458_024246 [Cirrhinus mrigala]|uniref:Uncharacterized protein n=1 Tax=Cirrhinus mrigala TaxID=683832 RepID=A0ABD0Q7H0_CIRMR